LTRVLDVSATRPGGPDCSLYFSDGHLDPCGLHFRRHRRPRQARRDQQGICGIPKISIPAGLCGFAAESLRGALSRNAASAPTRIALWSTPDAAEEWQPRDERGSHAKRANGTAVPDDITFRLFSTNFDGYTFGGAGGWALQIVVTRLNLHWSIARRQSKANTASCTCLMDDFAEPDCSHVCSVG
jgi:hypothetical protein